MTQHNVHGLYWRDDAGSHSLFVGKTTRDSLFDILRDSARVTVVESFIRDENGDEHSELTITKNQSRRQL